VFRRRGQHFGLAALGEEGPAGPFGLDEAAVQHDLRVTLGLAVVNGPDLPFGTVEVAGEREQLVEEQPPPVVGRVGLHLGQLLVNGALELTGFEQLARVHAESAYE